jgi:RHS repeat-associated protein
VYRFTGKERDTESGLDYFGARYYGSNMGRFMSPDWAAKAEPVPYAKLDNPQTLNLYSYVGYNPLSRFDPDGHYECTGSKSTCKTFDKAVDQLRKADAHFKPGTAQRTQLDKVLGVIGEKGKANGLVFTDKANNPNGVSEGAVLGTVTQKGVTTITLDPSAQESRSTEMTALTGHEAQHGVRNAELGRTPNSRADERQNEHDAYYMQALVDEGLGRNSTYGIYSVRNGYNWNLVDSYADESTKIWCANGGNCK